MIPEYRNPFYSSLHSMVMLSSILTAMNQKLSGSHARELATAISSFHRIPISPHFREAAVYCVRELESYGLPVHHHQFPTDGKKRYWNYTLPLEWKIETATLTIDESSWGDFEKCALSLIQRSHPVDITSDIVHITSEDEFSDKCEDKIIYSELPLETVKHWALHLKAAGIITVAHSPFLEKNPFFTQALSYHSLWGEPCAGFIISRKQSEILKRLLANNSVTAKMKITSSLYPGYIDVVDAYIPGKTDEEVVVLAHLCHPRPSANDNASGVSVLIEIARVLQGEIGHTLPIPRRGIRFLLVPEILGTVAYCASVESFFNSCIAGINLDMVGQNQRLCASTLFLERTPDALPSCVNDIAEFIGIAVCLKNHSPGRPFSFSSAPFSRLSDHSVLSSPDVGIPCPMLIQWPDYFYHTSLDTPDTLDPSTLKKVGVIAATYAYFLANAHEREAEWMADLVCENAVNRIEHEPQTFLKRDDSALYSDYLDYILEREKKTLLSITQWGDIDLTSHLHRLEEVIEKLDTDLHHVKDCSGPVPQKRFPGPIPLQDILLSLSFNDKRICFKNLYKIKDNEIIRLLTGYWTDGQRTISNITRCILFEKGVDNLEFLKWYFSFLETHDRIIMQ